MGWLVLKDTTKLIMNPLFDLTIVCFLLVFQLSG